MYVSSGRAQPQLVAMLTWSMVEVVPSEGFQMLRLSLSESMPAIGYLMYCVLPVRLVMSKSGKSVTLLSSFI